MEGAPPLGLDLRSGEIRTVVWATGFRPDYSWLEVPVFDHKGRIQHEGGIVRSPGMYLMGLPFLRRRKSSFMHGAEDETVPVSEAERLNVLSEGVSTLRIVEDGNHVFGGKHPLLEITPTLEMVTRETVEFFARHLAPSAV